jgi:hypothetical protein
MWAKVFPENREMELYGGEPAKQSPDVSEDDVGKYRIDVIPDNIKEATEKLKLAGSMKRRKVRNEDTDDEFKMFSFDRWHKNVRVERAGGPPKVTVNGKPWTIDDGLIGNGSKAKVTVTVAGPYTRTDEKGVKQEYSITTLESVEITELLIHDSSGGVEVNPAPAAEEKPKDDIPF